MFELEKGFLADNKKVLKILSRNSKQLKIIEEQTGNPILPILFLETVLS